MAAWKDYADVTVITENVDDLHERAGSRPVHDLHGSLSEFWCDTCGSRYDGPLPDMPEPELEKMRPNCECGGLIRLGIVWFGEQLPDEPWQAAAEAVATADAPAVVGTSEIVYPRPGCPTWRWRAARSWWRSTLNRRRCRRTPLSPSGSRPDGMTDAAAAVAGDAGELGPVRRPSATSCTGSGTEAGNVAS